MHTAYGVQLTRRINFTLSKVYHLTTKIKHMNLSFHISPSYICTKTVLHINFISTNAVSAKCLKVECLEVLIRANCVVQKLIVVWL